MIEYQIEILNLPKTNVLRHSFSYRSQLICIPVDGRLVCSPCSEELEPNNVELNMMSPCRISPVCTHAGVGGNHQRQQQRPKQQIRKPFCNI
jgi:hypothetical protein